MPLLTFRSQNTYSLSRNGQIWPRGLNSAFDSSSNSIFLVVKNTGSHSGSGLDFIMGYVFLERFFVVFDNAHSAVGFATTTYTNSIIN